MQKELLKKIHKLELRKQRNDNKIKKLEAEDKHINAELKRMYEINERFEKANNDALNILTKEDSLDAPV